MIMTVFDRSIAGVIDGSPDSERQSTYLSIEQLRFHPPQAEQARLPPLPTTLRFRHLLRPGKGNLG